MDVDTSWTLNHDGGGGGPLNDTPKSANYYGCDINIAAKSTGPRPLDPQRFIMFMSGHITQYMTVVTIIVTPSWLTYSSKVTKYGYIYLVKLSCFLNIQMNDDRQDTPII